MDSKGNMVEIPTDPKTFRKMEEEFGKLVPIPADEVEALKTKTQAERQAWYLERAFNSAPIGLDAGDARKAKNAAKRERKAKR